MKDSLHAYQLAKRGNSLRVMAEAVRWGKRGARVNTISRGIIITPLAKDQLTGPRGPGYRRMVELSAAGRADTPDEVGTVGALLMAPDGAFITGSDFLIDGGVTAPTGTAISLPNEPTRSREIMNAGRMTVLGVGATGLIGSPVIDEALRRYATLSEIFLYRFCTRCLLLVLLTTSQTFWIQ